MAKKVTALAPLPQVISLSLKKPWALLTLEAGRPNTKDGLRCTMHIEKTIKHGVERYDHTTFFVGHEAQREKFLAKIVKRTGLARERVEKVLFQMIEAVDVAWQEHQDTPTANAAPDDDACPYENTPTGIVRHTQRDKERITVRLTNFTAVILADVLEDDGVEARLFFEMGTNLDSQAQTLKIPASQFAGMNWVTEHLGGSAILMPGFGLKDHARAAIQMLSQGIASRHIYTHIGWRQLASGWAYLHAGGAVDGTGLLTDVAVDPGSTIARYMLDMPQTLADAQAALLASMQMLTVAPPQVVVPLYGAIWRALLGACDLSLHLTGATGKGKTELAALGQQHFGKTMHARNLPAAWSSTENVLELLAFYAKDAVFVIDDFCPTGSSHDIARLHAKADRVFRAQGNRSARQRMEGGKDRSRPAKPPRGIIVSTGEDIPHGASLRARICILDVAPTMVQWDRLLPCQADANAGLYTQALAAFVQWLAPHYEQVLATFPQELMTLRAAAVQTTHRRTPELIANLALGWDYFLDCARDLGVLSDDQCEQFWGWAWRTLGEVGDAQQAYQADADPVDQFFALLRGAITAGLAHVQDASRYGPPPDPHDWGWTIRERTTPTDAYQEWTPRGSCIGYLDDTRLYLEPNASFSVAQRLAESQRAPLALTQATLHKRMHERGLLLRQPSQKQNTINKRLGPAQKFKRVVDIAVSSLEGGISLTSSNISNNSNRGSNGQQNQRNTDEKMLLVPPRSSNKSSNNAVTSESEAVTEHNSVTDSVTGSVPASATELAPQLIEKKDSLLMLLLLLPVSDIPPSSAEKKWVTPRAMLTVILA